jgi:rhomboid protease GluP
MAIPIIISQQYLSTAFSKLAIVENVEEIEGNKALLYRIKNYYISPAFASFVDTSVTGRRINKKWNISAYFVFPITTDNKIKKIDEYKYWYGMNFKKTVSYTSSQEEIKNTAENFYKQCQSKLRWDNFKNINHLERLVDSFERDKFLDALQIEILDHVHPCTGLC